MDTDLFFIGGVDKPYEIAINGDYIYVANFFGNTIGKYYLNDGTVVDADFITGLRRPSGIAINGDYIYVANSTNDTIGKYDLSGGTVFDAYFITGLNYPQGIAINGDYICVTNLFGDTIGKYYLNNGSTVDADFITGLRGPSGIAINGDYIYVTNSFVNTIGKYNLSDSSGNNTLITDGLNYPQGIAINGDYIYVTSYTSDFSSSIVGKYNLTDGSVVDTNLITGLSGANGIAIDGNRIYVSNYDSNTVSLSIPIIIPIITSAYSTTLGELTIEGEGFTNVTTILLNNTLSYSIPTNGSINDTGTIITLTNISLVYVNSIIVDTSTGEMSNLYIPPQPFPSCFLKDTPITVDQGTIAIQKLNPNIHTINNNTIMAISQTVSPEKYLICIEKDGLDINYPNNKTIISKFHKILYKNNWIYAYKLLNKENKKIYKVDYNGEVLYNVLLEDYSIMTVNNLTVETLDPENLIGQLYNRNNTLDKKLDIVKEIKEYGLKRRWVNCKK